MKYRPYPNASEEGLKAIFELILIKYLSHFSNLMTAYQNLDEK